MVKSSDQPESFVSELRGRIKAHYLPIFAAAMAFSGLSPLCRRLQPPFR